MLILGGIASDGRAESLKSRVVAIEGPLELRLADERLVRLANVVVPGEAAMNEAATWLEQHLLGQAVTADLLETTTDRYDRYPARLADATDTDLARTLVAAGLALVEPRYTEGMDALFEAEREARAADRGFWADGRFQIMPAELVEAEPPRFAIVEGQVKDTGGRGFYAYLNFGDNWRDDFTVRLIRDDLEELLNGRPLEQLDGQILRVRGWLFDANGPMIQIEHPAQIAYLE